MLAESSPCSSIETSPFNLSRCQGPFAGHYWLSHGEASQMVQKFSVNFEGSFSDAKPVTVGKELDVSSNPKHQTICPKQSIRKNTSGNVLTYHVYRRRKPITKPSGTSTEDILVKFKERDDKLTDSLISEDYYRVTKREGDRLDNCLVYSRRKWRLKSAGTFTEHDCRETKRSDDQLDDSLVYGQKKQRVTINGISAEHSPGENKRRSDFIDGFVVYNRKRRRVKPSITLTEPDSGENKRRGDFIDGFVVYNRKRRRVKPSITLTEPDSRETKKSSDRLSIISYPAARNSSDCDRENDLSYPEHIHEFLVAEVACVSDGMVESCMHRTKDVGSKNYGLSSSESGISLVSIKSGACEATECFASGAMVVQNITKDISAKGLSVSVLRSDGLLDGAWPGSTSSQVEETIVIGASSSSRRCKICYQSGIVENMLICDKCEGVFHTYCCNVQMREILEIDEWLCPSCLKKKQKILKKTYNKKRGRAARERKWKTLPLTEVCSVDLMLRTSVRYKTDVRIGKTFQAEVPDWSGPITSDASLVGELLQINQSEYMHHFNINSASKLSSIGNWLQCREECIDGEICGKWRRAPLFEVQTDDWECYCCVFWDPTHADCGVPQELETSEILKQLKYVETLRPRLDAKRRKLEGSKGRGGHASSHQRSIQQM